MFSFSKMQKKYNEKITMFSDFFLNYNKDEVIDQDCPKQKFINDQDCKTLLTRSAPYDCVWIVQQKYIILKIVSDKRN